VFITGRRETVVDGAVEVIGSAAPAVTGDISNLAHLDRLYETIRSRGRGLDVLFANASVAASVAAFATLERVTEERFDTVLGVFFRENSGPRRRSARTGLAPPHVVGAAGPGGGGSGVSWAGS
jgi:NAD(P)-dependent dehydrogenase (short-subunit alcohol dehydrogenase family)